MTGVNIDRLVVTPPPPAASALSDEGSSRWTRSKAAWALAIGLATIVAAISAVLALLLH